MQFRHRCFGRPLQGHYPCFPLRTEAKNAAVSATHLSDLYQWRCRRLRYALLEIHLGTCPLYHDLSVPQACLRQRTQKLMAALSWLRGYGPMVPPNTGVLAFRCDVSSCFAHCSKTCPLSFFVPLYRERDVTGLLMGHGSCEFCRSWEKVGHFRVCGTGVAKA